MPKPSSPSASDDPGMSRRRVMQGLAAAGLAAGGTATRARAADDGWEGFGKAVEASFRRMDMVGAAVAVVSADRVQSVVNLPVEHAPGESFFYNNTVYAVGGYLPSLARGVAPAEIEASYVRQMHERVFGPAGMKTARIADDPRGVVARFARGYGNDLAGGREMLPYGAVGSYIPVGGTLATLTDMAAYVRLQLRRGVSVDGTRVVSAGNLAECWRPHVSIPTSPDLDPDATAAGYAMGWIGETYRDGTSFVWHNGGIDGFTTLIGFLPGHDIGIVVLNNMNPSTIGSFFYLSVLNELLARRFDINVGAAGQIDAAYDQTVAALRDVWNRSAPVDPAALAPHAGLYQAGYRLLVDARGAEIRVGSRVLPLRALPDGSFVIASGLLLNVRVNFSRGPDGATTMALEDVETVRRTVGLD